VRTGAAAVSRHDVRPGRGCVHSHEPGAQARPCPAGPPVGEAERRAAGRAGAGHAGRREGVPVTAGEGWPEMSFAELIGTVEFRVGARAHITVDSGVCRSCTTKACVTACPANLFAPTADGGILFSYEQCFECGTCYQVCN